MRFLFVHQNFPGQFRHVSQALSARGHEVVALGVNPPTGEPVRGVRHVLYKERPFPAEKVEHPLAGALYELADKMARGDSAARAMRALQESGFEPDVVVVHSGWGEAMFAKDVFPKARFIVYAEYYYGGEGSDTGFDPEFSRPSVLADQRVRIRNTHLLHPLSACDVALTPTQFQKSRHPAWAQERIRVIHEGIDTDRFRPDPKATVQLQTAGLTLRPGDETVTFVVRQLEPYRGYHIFMRALPLLQKLRPNARVVLVGGDGSSYSTKPPEGKTWRDIFLAEVVQQLDMSRVHFVGRVPHTVLTQLMQVSALHVYLTYPFVLSWSLLEAMSIGCLVLASDTGPVREVIEHGRNGLLTDFFDHDALARAMADALGNQEKLRPLREAARETIVSRYDLAQHCLPQMLELMENH
ncbi:glycosyltransferase [Caenimonas aquaedulcis]|uniref:Glycosyltransferase n=1 Tax=Caenimonas aquaedulcis TaxID=2793270 RepID=A0A931H5S6_9BURK|nr:glycosyltransferase [Caenimonas aquaedulcis]MBG9389181.1 glycosyltransferase [Caenimonas aquaedulcis]